MSRLFMFMSTCFFSAISMNSLVNGRNGTGSHLFGEHIFSGRVDELEKRTLTSCRKSDLSLHSSRNLKISRHAGFQFTWGSLQSSRLSCGLQSLQAEAESLHVGSWDFLCKWLAGLLQCGFQNQQIPRKMLWWQCHVGTPSWEVWDWVMWPAWPAIRVCTGEAQATPIQRRSRPACNSASINQVVPMLM